MKIFPIHTFLTHLRPHLDEIASLWQLRQWGDPFFPGIVKARIKYLTTGVLPDEIPADIILEKGILPVGVGGGFLDEHPSFSEGRKANECAASLVARSISKLDDVVLSRMISEILHCDSTNRVKPTQLSTLIKLRHRRNPSNPNRVIKWTMAALDRLYASGARFVKADGSSDTVRQAWTKLAKRRGWDNQQALTHVEELIAKSENDGIQPMSDLANVFRILRTADRRRASLWLREVLVDMYLDSCEFFKAVREINDKGNVVKFRSDRDTFPMIAISSDTEHVGLAARSRFCGSNALVIRKNSRGNTQIFLNVFNLYVRRERLNLDNLVRMLRIREQTRLGQPQSLWEDLAAEGTLRRIRMWYYAKDGDVILNGSLTTPDVKPSRLSLDEVLAISQSAFNGELVYRWRRQFAFHADNQLRKGMFRTRSQRDWGLIQAGQTSNHSSSHMPSHEEVMADLERIMVLGE